MTIRTPRYGHPEVCWCSSCYPPGARTALHQSVIAATVAAEIARQGAAGEDAVLAFVLAKIEHDEAAPDLIRQRSALVRLAAATQRLIAYYDRSSS